MKDISFRKAVAYATSGAVIGALGMLPALTGCIWFSDDSNKGLERKINEPVPKVQPAPEIKEKPAPEIKPRPKKPEFDERMAPSKIIIASYSEKELNETKNILYAEAANQPRKNRRLIGRTILNRVASKKYPNTIHNVIYQTNAFSCIKDSENKNWKQATGKVERNEYEDMIYERCGKDAKDILDGKKEGVKREDEIIAYHDISVDIKDLRKDRAYWKGLEEVYRNKSLIFYAPKKN
tara:strand:+ start:9734 stop:10444 length:711 start_codon:yes stop_codon:yes gene_type:complete